MCISALSESLDANARDVHGRFEIEGMIMQK